MRRSGLRGILVLGLLLASLALSLGLVPGGSEQVSAAGRARSPHCHGVGYDQVQGDRPTYTRKRLGTYPNRRRACHAVWLPNPRRYLVPQGLAVTGRTAWISGFRFREGYGERPCHLVRVDLRTGRRLGYHAAVYGRVGHRPRTYCRHGGGLLQRGRWLWIAEKNRLWLVDPSRPGRVLDARRVWRLRAPVRGSAIVATPRRIGLVPYQTSGRAHIYWFTRRLLFHRFVHDLGAHGRGVTQLGAVARTRVPRFVQGATVDARTRLFLTRSNLSCGELVTPSGRRLSFVPGAEGISFAAHDRRLWAVSESGARPYVVSRKPLTPGVTSFEWPRLAGGLAPRCGFPRY